MLIAAGTVTVIGRVPAATAYTVAAFTPITDPVATLRPNPAASAPRINPAAAFIRPNSVEA
jgi:hypothetical protein